MIYNIITKKKQIVLTETNLLVEINNCSIMVFSLNHNDILTIYHFLSSLLVTYLLQIIGEIEWLPPVIVLDKMKIFQAWKKTV